MIKEGKIKNVLQNGIFFIALILLTFYTIFRNSNILQIIDAISNVNKKYILIGIICGFTFIVCEGLNIRRNLKVTGYNISFLQGLKYALVGFFFSSITPSASGGQPMQVYYMHKDKIPISHSSLVLLINLASFQFVTVSIAILGYVFQHALIISTLGKIRYLAILGIVTNTIILMFILCAIFSEGIISSVINFVCFILKKFKYRKIESFREMAMAQEEEYKSSAIYFKENKLATLQLVCTTIVQIVAIHSIPFWVYRSFGLEGYSLLTVVFLQGVLYVSVSSLPLPGAVGISESGFMFMFKTLFPTTIISSAMIISRGVSFYLLILVSGIALLINYILKIRRRNYNKNLENQKEKIEINKRSYEKMSIENTGEHIEF